MFLIGKNKRATGYRLQAIGYRLQATGLKLEACSLKLKKGFTLVELLLVIAILGALVAMIVPRLAGRSEQAKIAVAKTDVTSNIPLALDLYELDNGRYPGNLQALLTDPGGLKNWNGPYIKRKPIDPWGNEYQYRYPPSHGKDYDIYSLGPDGVESNDDITNWEE